MSSRRETLERQLTRVTGLKAGRFHLPCNLNFAAEFGSPAQRNLRKYSLNSIVPAANRDPKLHYRAAAHLAISRDVDKRICLLHLAVRRARRRHSSGDLQLSAAFRFSSSRIRAVIRSHYNFDFDDYVGRNIRDLKFEHTQFLIDKVLPLLENDSGQIWMQGSASRIGTNKWNMETSDNRVTRVGNFLYERGIPLEQMQMNAVGEDLVPATHSEDDERDRGVSLWVFPKEKHDPPPKPKVPARPIASRYFKIAMITGLSASQALNVGKIFKGVKLGGGLALDGIFFMVWDYRNGISCLYVYIGIGLGAGLSFTLKISATIHGPWTPFTTEKRMSCWQFGRWARFTSAGAWSKSVNWITLETPKGIDNVESLAIDTGTTLGAGMSSTIGDFIRVDQPRRFYGP